MTSPTEHTRFLLRRYGEASEHVKDAAVSLGEALELLPERSESARQVRAALLTVNPIQAKIREDLDQITRRVSR